MTAGACILGFLTTIDRTPLPWTDEITYASIARSLQRGEGGAPSTLRDSPNRVDHVAFYGPVFFYAATLSVELMGFSITAFRVISAIGALLVACAAAILVLAFGERGSRPLWSFTLLLLTPELGSSATGGTMDTLAVGITILALAVFVRGVLSGVRPILHGGVAGMLLALGALTTPRALPFVCAFITAGVFVTALPSKRTPFVYVPLLATIVSLAAILAVWGTYTHGTPIHYVSVLAWVATHENTGVTWLPTVERVWFFSPWAVVTTLFAIVGTFVAARSFDSRKVASHREVVATTFVLAVGWINLVVGLGGMNFTFVYSMYFAIPLLAIVLALPRRVFPQVDSRVVGLLICGLLTCDVGVRAAKYARVVSTWAARDPGAIETFVRDHVPEGSDVVGPNRYYLYAVEGAGSRYLSDDSQSPADWARWIRRFDPRLVLPPVRHSPIASRFLMWPSQESLPDGYTCAEEHRVATFQPAPSHDFIVFNRAGTLGLANGAESYPPTSLYRLPAGCPGGGNFQPAFVAPFHGAARAGS
jgi:hypothetical protein